jgi:hypothetical protein
MRGLSDSDFKSLKEGDVILSEKYNAADPGILKKFADQTYTVIGLANDSVLVNSTHMSVGFELDTIKCGQWGIDKKHIGKFVVMISQVHISQIVTKASKVLSTKSWDKETEKMMRLNGYGMPHENVNSGFEFI